MSYSDIIGSISGVLQFAVAVYALRVSRMAGMSRVGWMFCGSFSLLALVHVLISVHPFGIDLHLDSTVNFLYELISILILANIAQVEVLIRRRQHEVRQAHHAQSESESRLALELSDARKSRDELRSSVTRLQSELDHQKHVEADLRQAHEKELTALRDSEEQSLAALGGARAELDQNKRQLDLLQARHAEQIALLGKTEEELRSTVATLRDSVEQENKLREQMEASLQDQLAAAQKSEHDLRESVTTLQAEIDAFTPIRKDLEQQLNTLCFSEQDLQVRAARLESKLDHERSSRLQLMQISADLVQTLRQSGIHEIAVMAQTRTAYIGRLANLLRDNAKHLKKFLTGTQRGRHLPFSMALLVEHLSDEQFLLLKRIESVQVKVQQTQEKLNQLGTPDSPVPPNETMNDLDPQPQTERAPAIDLPPADSAGETLKFADMEDEVFLLTEHRRRDESDAGREFESSQARHLSADGSRQTASLHRGYGKVD